MPPIVTDPKVDPIREAMRAGGPGVAWVSAALRRESEPGGVLWDEELGRPNPALAVALVDILQRDPEQFVAALQAAGWDLLPRPRTVAVGPVEIAQREQELGSRQHRRSFFVATGLTFAPPEELEDWRYALGREFDRRYPT